LNPEYSILSILFEQYSALNVFSPTKANGSSPKKTTTTKNRAPLLFACFCLQLWLAFQQKQMEKEEKKKRIPNHSQV